MFGCTIFVHIGAGEQSKLDAKSRKMVFLRYPQGVKGYRLWDPLEKKVVISRDVIFDENLVLQRRNGMEEQQEVQQDSAGQLSSYSLLPLIGAPGGLGIQVEHSPKVSPLVERARMDEKS